MRGSGKCGTWIFFPTGVFHLGRYGTDRHCCVPTSCFRDSRETRGTIQPNPLLAEVQAKLLAVALSNCMPAWGSFIARMASLCDAINLTCVEGRVPEHSNSDIDIDSYLSIKLYPSHNLATETHLIL